MVRETIMPMSDVDPKDPALITRMAEDPALANITHEFLVRSAQYRYSYNFTWLGRPIIQYPADIVAMQEIIWKVRPEIIIETGIAHGGSLVFYASMLHLLGGDGFVIGVDVDIREHNRRAIENHAFASRIRMIEGSSTSGTVAERIRTLIAGRSPVLVALDSNHTHDHVLAELRLYSTFVSKGSYLVVFDTVIEDMPLDFFPNRPWSVGNNPKTAVRAFLKESDRFEIDAEMHNKLLVTVAPSGFLRCVND